MTSNGLDSWIESEDFRRLADQISPDVLKRVRETPPPSPPPFPSLFEEKPPPPFLQEENDPEPELPDESADDEPAPAVALTDLQRIRSRLANLNAQARASGILKPEEKSSEPAQGPEPADGAPSVPGPVGEAEATVAPLEWDDGFLEELEQFSRWAIQFLRPMALWITDPQGTVVRSGGTPPALTRATQRFAEATFRLGEDLPAARQSTVYVALGPERWLAFVSAASVPGTFHLQLLMQAPPPYEMMATVQIGFARVLQEKDAAWA